MKIFPSSALAIACMILVFSGCAISAPAQRPNRVPLQKPSDAVETSVFHVSSSDNCIHCDRLIEKIRSIKQSGRWGRVTLKVTKGGPPPWPQSKLIDRKGRVVHRFTGDVSRDRLIEKVKKYLGEE